MGKFFNKAKELNSKLTLREKIGQIAQIGSGFNYYTIDEKGNIELTEEFKNIIKEYGIGEITALLRADPWSQRNYSNGITIENREKISNKIQDYIQKNTRMKIPAMIDIESSHGVQALGSVTYPTGIACAATFNPQLYGKMMQSIGKEIELSGNHIAFVTLIDLARDPRWGRSEECLGEDPYLASKFAKEAVENIQKSKVLACAKHFVSAGICEAGLNGAEIKAGKRELEDVEYKTAKTCVDAHCGMIMTTYNTIDGVPLHFNHYLLTDILRDKWKYDGILISDGTGVYGGGCEIGISKKDSAILAIKAGIDISLVDDGCFTELENAVNNGEIDISYIDRACIRVLEKKFELGLFDNPYVKEGQLQDYLQDKHCEKIAYDIASESIIMLKNNGILPLSKNKKIVAIGENSDDIYHILGDYTSWKKDNEGATIYKALQEKFDSVDFEIGWTFANINNFDKAIEKAKNADVILLAMGGTSKREYGTKFLYTGALEKMANYVDCGEGVSLAELRLPKQQIELLKELKKLNKPIITVVIGGRSYVLDEVCSLSDATLFALYPGQEGGRAITDIILGNINPSGKLPITLPMTGGVLPICHDVYRRSNKNYADFNNPMYLPFGYGLSYSNFEYQDLQIEKVDKDIKVSFTIKNNSNISGKEVAQVYMYPLGDSVKHRQNQLVGFNKIELKGNEEKTLSFIIENPISIFYAPIEPRLQITIGPLEHEKFDKVEIKL